MFVLLQYAYQPAAAAAAAAAAVETHCRLLVQSLRAQTTR
jgi:hypothetical protein